MRLLAFFDLLGFRNLVMNTPLEEMVGRFGQVYSSIGAAAVRHEAAGGMAPFALADRYSQLEQTDLAGIRKAFEEATGLTLLLMSDSIVVYSQPCDATHAEFERLLSGMLRISRTIITKLFEFRLPSRGALALGEFHADAKNGIYVGRALVEAYEAAESQQWIGAVIAPSLSEHVARLERMFSSRRLADEGWLARPSWDYLQFNVPFKNGPRRAYVVNWASNWTYGGNVRQDFFAEVITGDPAVDTKYANTLKFLQDWTGA